MADNQLALTVDERIYKQWFQIADAGAWCGRAVQGEVLLRAVLCRHPAADSACDAAAALTLSLNMLVI
jgi:hypothetical protein